MVSVDEINNLKEELENKEMFIDQLKEYNNQLKARIRPFEDSYFNGLSPIEIAELAKKSIRLTCENRKLEDLSQEIKAIAENNIDCKQYEIDHDCFNDTRCKALRELIETLQQILDLIKFLRQQCEDLEKWLLNNRMGSALREIAREMRQGKVPSCPHCRKPFDLEKINTWWSKEYAEAQFQQELLNSAKEDNQ